MAIFALLIGLLTVIPHERALAMGTLASLASLWIWWIANAKHPDLLDTNNDAAVGGPTDRPLSGDLAGFKVEG
jgi:hypothetical protein